MRSLIVLSAIVAVALARPGVLLNTHSLATLHLAPLTYAKLVPGAPIGFDGRVVDTPEVAVAKAEHAAAHINEKINLANEAVKSTDHVITYSALPTVLATEDHVVQPLAIAKLVEGAPIGPDGRVVDTPEVAIAKAEHAAAHINERIEHAAEAARSSPYQIPVVLSAAPVVQKYLI